MTKDEALDLALETLESIQAAFPCETVGKRITAIKQARALDKMADNARELGLDYEPDAYGYAKRLAEAIWKKHYQSTAPHWRPFDHLIGVLTQIDNMTSGLIAPPAHPAPDLQAELEATNRQVEILSDALAESRREVAQLKLQPAPTVQEPVAWRVKWPAIGGGHKWIMVDKPLMEKEGFVNEALYTTPPAAQRQWVGLTEGEIEDIWYHAETGGGLLLQFAQAIEAKLKEKNT